MRQIRDDLWETTPDSPLPGLTTHAYLWTPSAGANVLFYSVATDRDLDRVEELGGVADQYLSHQDEAGPMLARIAERFGARLHAPAAEAEAIGRFRRPDRLLAGRSIDPNGVEVVEAPGHSPGSTAYLVPGAGGLTYLFTGDSLYRADDGRWSAGYIPGYSDADTLARSVRALGALRPDVVISSAFRGDDGAHEVDPDQWPSLTEEAAAGIRA
jgi:glyoxylase-like metal-dependent hydrolase (beta-lactamase superfamily II)